MNTVLDLIFSIPGYNLVEQLYSGYRTIVYRGIREKDIKPANILIHPQTKQVKLIDFSIASLLPKETTEIKNPNGLEGTLSYLSPEQTGRMNRGIDYRSDFYSLGVTLYELLTGQLPFQSNDPMELVHCHIAKLPNQLKGKREEIKANPNRIIITTSALNKDVKIAIADNGKGMNESVKQKIFDHLFTTKSVDKGTGLGLAIAHQIVVEKHGGTLDVNSTPGKGTEFTIIIPIQAQTKS